MKVKSIFLIVVLLMMTVLPASPALGNRSHSYPRVEVYAEILSDGSMTVAEKFIVDFRGTFSGMFRWIHKSPGMEITNMVMEENGKSYEFNPGSTYGPPGTYFIINEPTKLTVDWSFTATNQTRTFIIRYKVLNAVKMHNDVAELYYKFFGDESETAFDNVSVKLTLPEGANQEQILAWGHGPLYGNVTIQSPRVVTWEVSPLPQKTFLEGRVLFPIELVPGGTNKTNIDAYDSVLVEEQKWAKIANLKRTAARMDMAGGGIVLILSAGLFFYLNRRFKNKYRPAYTGDYYRELPADYEPAVLGVLWHFGSPKPSDFTATIIDLARRGFITVEEFVPDKKGFFNRSRKQDYRLINTGQDTKQLKAFENRLLKLLFEEIGKETGGEASVSLGDIEEFTKHKKNRFRFAGFWYEWEQSLLRRSNSFEFFDTKTMAPKLAQAGISVLMFPLGIFIASKELPFTGLALIAASIIGLISISRLKRRSQRGTDDYSSWAAFRRFLLHFSAMERHQIPSLVIWEHYLVYAITLGVAKEVLNQLKIVFASLDDGTYRFGQGWYIGNVGPEAFGHFAIVVENLSKQIVSSVKESARTASSSSSSGSGSGGGFSGGGGGGQGGGGVGVR